MNRLDLQEKNFLGKNARRYCSLKHFLIFIKTQPAGITCKQNGIKK